MSGDDPEKTEDELASLMAACDEAMAEGDLAEAVDAAATPAELQPRLQRNMAMALLVREALRRPGPDTPPHIQDATPPDFSSPGLPWTQLGRFEIRRELGRGGCGIVYLAYDPVLRREVALKVPRAEVGLTPDMRERFQREAQAAASLEHPNLVPVFEAGAVGPVCYLASAYCPGVTLSEWLQDHPEPVPFADAARLLATLADAVQHAHTRGVLHRDLKPSNVLLQFSREPLASAGGEVALAGGSRLNDCMPRITDFGLAKFLLEGTRPGQTLSGAIVGTPNYMAPEQAAGKVHGLTPAADVYGLGAILYELLAGRPPFVGENDLDTLSRTLTEEPAPPSRLRPHVPRDLETICLKCLEKEPAKRYPSARLLADDVHRYLEDRPILARRPTLPQRASKWARRHKPVVWSAGVSAVVLVAMALVGLAVSNVRIRSEVKQKEEALAEAKANHERAEERRKEAYDSFKLALKAVDEYSLKVAQDRRLQEHDLRTLRMDLLRSAIEFYRQFVAQRGDDPALRMELARACRRLGNLTREMGDHSQTIAYHQQSVDLLVALMRSQPNDQGVARALTETYVGLGFQYRQMNQPIKAEAEYKKGLEVLEPFAQSHPGEPENDHLRAACHNNLGNVYRDLGQDDRAMAAYQAALAIQERLAQNHPDLPEYTRDLVGSHNNLGTMFFAQRDFERATVAYQKGLAIQLRLVQAHPKVDEYRQLLATLHINLGNLDQNTRDWPRAESNNREAVKILESLVKEHGSVPQYRRSLARTYNNLGALYTATEQAEPAEREFGNALAILEPLAKEYPQAIDIVLSLAMSYYHRGAVALDLRGQPEAARDWYSRSIERCEAILRQQPRQTFGRLYLHRAFTGRARCLNQLDRHAEALADWGRARDLDEGKDPIFRASYARGLASAGDTTTALKEAALAAQGKAPAVEVWWELACAYALCAGAVRPDSLADDHAAKAVSLLAQARVDGYFGTPAHVAQLRQEKAMKPLADREDFKRFLSEVERTPKKGP